MKIQSLADLPAVELYLQRIGAEPRSLRTAVVTELRGRYKDDLAVITIAKDGTITIRSATEEYAPTAEERRDIEADCRKADWPSPKLLTQLIDPPEMVRSAAVSDVFEFRNPQREISMLQVRIEVKGKRAYVPWTFWDDGQWRKMEPEGPLPLWGLEQLNQHTTVFVHEGAKAARNTLRMIAAETPEEKDKLANHPWREELQHAAHLGWIGGAHSAHRTDWSVLQKLGVKHVYIVSDNDTEGKAAVPIIAKNLHCTTEQVQFTEEFPASFDLADPFPDKMFGTQRGEPQYIGPLFRSCIVPATWATNLKLDAKGKPHVSLRGHVASQWVYVQDQNTFVYKKDPRIQLNKEKLNGLFAPLSDATQKDTAALLLASYNDRVISFTYRPDMTERIVTEEAGPKANLFLPTRIKPKDGDVTPFLDYLGYMFPIEKERREMMRWIATLVARPHIKMRYGMLLCSEKQGVGKTWLGESILGPLVGEHNTSCPEERAICDSQFNGWVAHKRLVVIQEIYAGHSRAPYNRLKSVITDRRLLVNKKHQQEYEIENWAHIWACSNSLAALKIEHEDRRWYVPEVTEVAWTLSQFEEFRDWLTIGGGLQYILHWAETFGDYVREGETAPDTPSKRMMIENVSSDAEHEAADLADVFGAHREPIALGLKPIFGWVRESVRGQVYEKEHDVKKIMRQVAGVYWWKDQIRTGRYRTYYAVNEEGLKKLKEVAPLHVNPKNVVSLADKATPAQRELVLTVMRKLVRSPHDLMAPPL